MTLRTKECTTRSDTCQEGPTMTQTAEAQVWQSALNAVYNHNTGGGLMTLWHFVHCIGTEADRCKS